MTPSRAFPLVVSPVVLMASKDHEDAVQRSLGQICRGGKGLEIICTADEIGCVLKLLPAVQ